MRPVDEEAAPAPLRLLPRERLWIRVAAFGIDLLLLAGLPLLLTTGVVFAVLVAVPAAPAPLGELFHAAQILAVVLFLFRDSAGTSPGKKLFGLRLVLRDGTSAGPGASLVRNILLLMPLWNLLEIAALLRRANMRRPGDRLAGTFLVET